jgi:hypothetical protein
MGFCGIYVTIWSLFQSIIFNDWITARQDALDTCYTFMDQFY